MCQEHSTAAKQSVYANASVPCTRTIIFTFLSTKDTLKKQELLIKYNLDKKDHLVPMTHGVDCWPSYFVVGGLVFVPLSSPFLEMVFGTGKKTRRADIPIPVLTAINGPKTRQGQQIIILVQVRVTSSWR
jgi:hypothetical protein